jgi:hypothetical protein
MTAWSESEIKGGEWVKNFPDLGDVIYECSLVE